MENSSKTYLLQFVQSLIEKKKQTPEKFELEARLGWFDSKVDDDKKRIRELKKGFAILQKEDLHYMFKTKLKQESKILAETYFKSNQDVYVENLKVDFQFNDLNDRVSLILDQNNTTQGYRGHSELIQKNKQKNSNNNIDVINKKISYRITLSPKDQISQLKQDVLKFLDGQKNEISTIRAKKTLLFIDGNFQVRLSTVYQLSPEYQTEIVDEIINCLPNYYNPIIDKAVRKIFECIKEFNHQPQYELEIELINIPNTQNIAKQLAQQLVDKIEYFSEKFVGPTLPSGGSYQNQSKQQFYRQRYQ